MDSILASSSRLNGECHFKIFTLNKSARKPSVSHRSNNTVAKKAEPTNSASHVSNQKVKTDVNVGSLPSGKSNIGNCQSTEEKLKAAYEKKPNSIKDVRQKESNGKIAEPQLEPPQSSRLSKASSQRPIIDDHFRPKGIETPAKELRDEIPPEPKQNEAAFPHTPNVGSAEASDGKVTINDISEFMVKIEEIQKAFSIKSNEIMRSIANLANRIEKLEKVCKDSKEANGN